MHIKRMLVAGAAFASLSVACLAGGGASAAEITGAGATFPYPVYAKWADAYKNATGNQLNYQSIGSGGGIKQINAGTVDFGASDMPLKAEDLAKGGLVQWPMIMGGVVVVANLPGIAPGQVRVSGPLLADIFLGKVAKWNDPAVVKENPGVTLPDQAIAVIHRSDGSGTTFQFATYLSMVSDEWKTKVGANTAVEWPTGMGGKGNEGVANFTGQTPGAIGFVEYAYALQNKMTWLTMQSKDGGWVKPETATFQSAAAHADWAHTPGYAVILTNQPGATSWPMTGASFILMHAKQDKPEHAVEALKFFAWSYANGAQAAAALDYIPIPEEVVKMVQATWTKEITSTDGKPLWPAH